MLIRSPESREDIRAVAPLFDAYRIFYKAAPNKAGALDFLLDRWQLRESVLYVAYEDSRPVGFVHMYPMFLSVEMRRFWLLNDLYVDPSVRKSGVGRALMRRAEQHARETGAAGLTLSTAADNAKAQALYASEGYVRDDAFYVFNRNL